MLVLTPEEVKRVLSGSDAVTRAFPGRLPYAIGQSVPLGAPLEDGKPPLPFAGVKILTLRPTPITMRKTGPESDGLAKAEGFESAHHWFAHWNRHFKDRSGPRFTVIRIRFVVEKWNSEAVEILNGSLRLDTAATRAAAQNRNPTNVPRKGFSIDDIA